MTSRSRERRESAAGAFTASGARGQPSGLLPGRIPHRPQGPRPAGRRGLRVVAGRAGDRNQHDGMRVVILADAEALADAAATLVRERVRRRPNLVLAAPAGRTPRRMYAVLHARQAQDPVDYSGLRLFAVDELCLPAPRAGFFWQQIRREFLAWAKVPEARCSPFRVDAADLEGMCRAYEASIAESGGLDLVVLGLGPNGHLASNEPGSSFASRTRPVTLLPETVAYIRTDAVNVEAAGGAVAERAVTLGLATIQEAREVVVLVSGEAKREALRRFLDGPVSPAVPATALRGHPRCTVLADRAARP